MIQHKKRHQGNGLSLGRKLADHGFAWLAFGCTFLAMALLLLFFIRLGFDVNSWFKIMPERIAKFNLEIERKALEFDEETKRELDALAREKETRMKQDPNNADSLAIRYDKVINKKIEDRAKTKLEIESNLNTDKRSDVSCFGMLMHFISAGPSSQPQDAGIKAALLSSLLLGAITIIAAIPLGVATAIYLEEYRAQSWIGAILQLNVNNLAGVPSIMYAILGAYVFVELIFKPLESPAIAARNTLGGGLTLALLVLPIIIVSTQEAIRAVPVSLRHASLALGASRWQTIWKIVIPSSLPGILTGMILALSRAMGEAAPLVLFGAALYVNFSPSLFSRFTALPMQIYSWSDDPDPAFHYNAALASAILITMLLGLNSIAIFFRYFVQQKLKG
ncbi:MAG: phosphate ABC transporter permease PstA [Gemmataceae bacterium]|jgi:phosphate transport system permease protein